MFRARGKSLENVSLNGLLNILKRNRGDFIKFITKKECKVYRNGGDRGERNVFLRNWKR